MGNDFWTITADCRLIKYSNTNWREHLTQIEQVGL
jgi:hypothetical protein